jgi:hypothetical protein
LASTLVQQAEVEGLPLRVAGSVGVALFVGIASRDRPAPLKDIDLATARRFRAHCQAFLGQRGWTILREYLLQSENRESFASSETDLTVDVYYDEIDGNHPVAITRVLHASFPTIPWAHLLLSKLQRRPLRLQDEWDACALIGKTPQEVDWRWFRSLLGRDWGLYTTVTDNLHTLLSTCPEVATRVANLLDLALSSPKTLRWLARSLIGRRIRWWRQMYDVGSRLHGG